MPREERTAGGTVRRTRRAAAGAGLAALLLMLVACGAPPLVHEEGVLLVVEGETLQTLNLKSDGRALDGTTVKGTIEVVFSSSRQVRSVAFYLDDPQRSGTPRRIDTSRPFTMTLDTTGLGEGDHVVTAVATGARTVVRHARFTVRNTAGTAPTEPAPSPTPPASSPSASDVLWFADHESGTMAQWWANSCGGIYNNGGATASTSTRVARNGRYAAQMTIQNVSSDQGARLFRWCESRSNTELFYSTWMYFPTTHQATAGWWNVFQYKSKTPTRHDPFFILNIGNTSSGAMRFYLYDWQERRSYQQSVAVLPVGRWVHVEVRYRSSSSTDGRVTVWQDGVQLFDVSGVRTRYSDGDLQWSLAHYTSAISPDPSTIYVDDVAISRTRLGPQTNLATLMAPRTAALGGE
jgi:hypothetical protein